MMYKIYHVPKKKIGATKDYPFRCLKQGFKEGEFYIEDQASEGCGAEFSGKLEKFWQWYYALEEPSNTMQYHESGFVTGVAQEAALASANHNSKTGVFQKAGVKSQLDKGIHTSQTGTSGFHTGAAWKASLASPNHVSKTGNSPWNTGVAARASVASPNHISKQILTCSRCGKIGRGARMKFHIDKGTLSCPL